MDHEAFMRQAIDLATEHMLAGEGGPFGALIVRDGAVIGRGWNQVIATNDPTAHAEVVAIREACAHTGAFKLADCELYTSCEPCPMCLGAVYWAGLRRVHFSATRHQAAAAGFSDEFLYQELPRDLDQRQIPFVHLLGELGQKPFDLWIAKDDRVPY